MDWLDDSHTKPIISARAIIVHPYAPREDFLRSPEDRLDEAKGLAEAIYLKIVDALTVQVRKINPALYLGTGKVEEIGEKVKAGQVELVVVDTEISPGQQRNLEEAWGCKVIDRTALILEIFGERARTNEGVLQVELATLEYQKSRLVRSWTHLERQRGGFGFTGGPGETQIEIDRRMVRDRIALIKGELEKVKRTRSLHRKSRDSVPYPIVALVGYTNAGKSTLFNRLTGATVLAKDMLFATLDPTMRLITLPSKQKVIISDTVGFISNLPTELVAAFRATLEEVIEADIILHVRDMAAYDTDAQKIDVNKVLTGLGLGAKIESTVIEVLNKTDKLETSPRTDHPKWVAISALTGEGCDELLKIVDQKLSESGIKITASIPAADGKLLAWLYRHGKQVDAVPNEDKMDVSAILSAEDVERFEALKKQGQK
ncbi:MAG: GTPase HflX [Proteobacteria bacterium]|nr:GTPase HflX [Pseudomonadota bacterium]